MVSVMRRVLLGLAILAAACGGGADAPVATTNPPATIGTTVGATASPTTSAPSTTEAATPGATLPASAEEAPDFALALGTGGTFALSEEQKPVYLVFWAEW